MIDVSSNEAVGRVLRSLKENNAEFARQRYAQRNAPFLKVLMIFLVFASGVAAGTLLMTAH